MVFLAPEPKGSFEHDVPNVFAEYPKGKIGPGMMLGLVRSCMLKQCLPNSKHSVYTLNEE